MCHLEMSGPGYLRLSNTSLCKTCALVLMLKKGVWTSDKTWKLLCMQWQHVICCHRGVLPPPDIAAPNAIAAREIHIWGEGVCHWPAVPLALILSKLAWEATEKQWPRGSGRSYTSVFSHCWLASSKWGRRAFCAPRSLGDRKGKERCQEWNALSLWRSEGSRRQVIGSPPSPCAISSLMKKSSPQR